MVSQLPGSVGADLSVAYFAIAMASLLFLAASVSLCATITSRIRGKPVICLYEGALVALSVGFLLGSPVKPMDTVVSRLCWISVLSSLLLAVSPLLWKLKTQRQSGERPSYVRHWSTIGLATAIQLLFIGIFLEIYLLNQQTIEITFRLLLEQP